MSAYVLRYGVYVAFALAPVLAPLLPDALLERMEVAEWSFFLVYAFLAATVLAAMQLNRGAMTLACAAILLIFLLERYSDPAWLQARPLAVMGLPWGMLLLQCFREAHLFSIRGLARIIVFAAPGALLFAARDYAPAELGTLIDLRLEFFPVTTLAAMAGLLVYSLFGRNFKAREESFVFSLVTLPLTYLVLHAGAVPGDVGRLAAEAGVVIILAHAAYFMYWKMAYVDELTGIRNRRALEEYLERTGGTFSVVMMDVDHFKRFNDTYGHEAGDNVLRIVAQTLRSIFADSVFRYGGEEFCALLRGSTPEEAEMYAGRAVKYVRAIDFRIRRKARPRSPGGRAISALAARLRLLSRSSGGKRVPITLSAGIAARQSRSVRPADVVAQADAALYRAKKAGRNRVAR